MEEKVLITNSEYEINKILDKGWNIKTVVPQHVSTSTTFGSSNLKGDFLIIFERKKI